MRARVRARATVRAALLASGPDPPIRALAGVSRHTFAVTRAGLGVGLRVRARARASGWSRAQG